MNTSKNNAVNSQLFYLFISSFTILFTGMGLFPILPLYAAEFGATSTMIGVFFALMYASNAAGPLFTSWLADRLPRRTLFVGAAALGVPALLLVGWASALWQVVVLISLLWFSGGMTMTLISVFTGLAANDNSRGKAFSLMSLAYPLGALVGGAAVGQLVTRHGYTLMFVVLGVTWVVLPLIGRWGIKDEQPLQTSASATAAARHQHNHVFYVLLVTVLLASVALGITRLGTSLSMQSLHFAAGAMTSTATVSGLAAIPATLLIGALSDRLGHRRFLGISYGLVIGAALTLTAASQLWHFWLAATLVLIALCVSGATAAAAVAETLSPAAMGRGLSWLNVVGSGAGIVSFASAGYVMDTWGATALYGGAAVLAGFATLQLWQLQRQPSGRNLAVTIACQSQPLLPRLTASLRSAGSLRIRKSTPPAAVAC